MTAIESFFGMPWELALLLICFILLIADLLLFTGDFLTYGVHILLTVLIVCCLPIDNGLVLTLLGFLIYGVILALHFLFWKTCIAAVINKIIAPDKIRLGNERLLGCSGKLRYADGQWLIRIGDEWLPCTVRNAVQADPASGSLQGTVTEVADRIRLIVTVKES